MGAIAWLGCCGELSRFPCSVLHLVYFLKVFLWCVWLGSEGRGELTLEHNRHVNGTLQGHVCIALLLASIEGR